MTIENNINRFQAFIEERHRVYQRKTAKLTKPWTSDPILQKYRFCNVYRELDTQTKWLSENWADNNDPDYWFACVVFRLTNWHETAIDLGYPVPFDAKKFVRVLATRKMHGDKVYSGAYTISTNGVKQVKHEYLALKLKAIWKDREKIRPHKGERLEDFYQRLIKYDAMGTFLAAQVVADAKFTGELRKAKDWWTFVAPGPGSKRGLNRVMGRTIDAPVGLSQWLAEFKDIHFIINDDLQGIMPRISAQDLQNCLCEFDKYERVRLGEGRPRSTYPGE